MCHGEEGATVRRSDDTIVLERARGNSMERYVWVFLREREKERERERSCNALKF